jgi:hypothetical protein
MVGATLEGQRVELPSNISSALGAPETAPSAQQEDSRDEAREREQSNDQSAEQADLTPGGLSNAVQSEAAAEVYGAPRVAEQSANDTVNQMVAASGIAPSASGIAQTGNPAFGARQPQAAAPQAAAAYGGAMPSSQGYYVFVPGQQQQFGQPAAVPAANLMAAAPMPMAQQQPQQVAVVPAMGGGIPRQSMDQRSPFNPSTSAIVSPMGLRRRSAQPTVPMLPSAGSSEGGAQRLRVWVGR